MFTYDSNVALAAERQARLAARAEAARRLGTARLADGAGSSPRRFPVLSSLRWRKPVPRPASGPAFSERRIADRRLSDLVDLTVALTDRRLAQRPVLVERRVGPDRRRPGGRRSSDRVRIRTYGAAVVQSAR